MCDPIPYTPPAHIDQGPFAKSAVEGDRRDPETGDGFPSWHYNQMVVRFDPESIVKALGRLGVPKTSKTVVFGAYTGEFAACLRDIGMKVIYTDPMKEWAERGKQLGFESYQYTAEGLPWDLISRCNLVSTFECYYPFGDSNSIIYTALRFLTRRNGIIFAESRQSREGMTKDAGKRLGQMKSALNWLMPEYELAAKYAEAGDVRLYHYHLGKHSRELAELDCNVIRALWDMFPSDTELSDEHLSRVAARTGLSGFEVYDILLRLRALCETMLCRELPELSPFFRGELSFFGKRYWIVEGLREPDW